MANSGGGVIAYGLRETQELAMERVDVGDFDEIHERALRRAANPEFIATQRRSPGRG